MSTMKKMVSLCLLLAAPVLAGSPRAPVPASERYARRCRSHQTSRTIDEQGTMLWGTWGGWTDKEQRQGDGGKSVLVSANLNGLLQGSSRSLRLEGGHLGGAQGVVGSVLQGTASDGRPVEVAICDAQPSPDDPDTVEYQIEAWNHVAQDWENPCVQLGTTAKAMVVGGVWDTHGAHHDAAGKITFACENGAIAKCIRWGYKPWTIQDGRSLADEHQACTRMARADYCGDGATHTRQGITIDHYATSGVTRRAMQETASWKPAQAYFEAAWRPDGASCITATRDGRPLEGVLQGCPRRFQVSTADLGDGDRCAVQRSDKTTPDGILRDRVGGRVLEAKR